MIERIKEGRTHFVYYTALKAKGKSLRLLGISLKQLRGRTCNVHVHILDCYELSVSILNLILIWKRVLCGNSDVFMSTCTSCMESPPASQSLYAHAVIRAVLL